AWNVDADETRAAIGTGPAADWVVVDHYALDWRWETAIRCSTDRVMAIDDLADRVHDCDLLLDQNLLPDADARYRTKVPRRCTCLLGPAFVLLHPMFADLHGSVLAREGAVRRVFVSIGGTDPHNLTGRILAGVLSLDRGDIEVDVVMPSLGAHD